MPCGVRASGSEPHHGGRLKLGKILTIGQVAELAGWSYKRMRRRLVALHESSGGKLLQERRGPRGKKRWTVSLVVLKELAPRWFSDTDKEEAEELRAEVERLRRLVDVMAERRVSEIRELKPKAG